MILLDEQLKNSGLVEHIAGWYRGPVVAITSLRPGTVIKDDALPMLLRVASHPTFVTINVTDFWRRIGAEKAYCVTCFPLPDDRVDEISGLLRQLFRFSEFGTKRARCGKVALVSHTQVRYYQPSGGQVYTLSWPPGMRDSGLATQTTPGSARRGYRSVAGGR